ncbi:Y-family DNA polymerase [Pseudoroseicyclus tamaricis]|uniref:DNA polymerase Y family protein n=1 Tax=Pseudoroseicyclus tamaricis TaxID=2705421 RepID=A0A6B2JRP9_9RHOB|nr:DNA polymerase Y family protein [Pseudoroseicyclus tamaricis]NDV00655.1 DNA polymerase Y family protein [Pseudoroseicyclus tamaricis]
MAGAAGQPARRVLSIDLPLFAIERHLQEAARQGEAVVEELPLVLTLEGRHGPVVQAASRTARAEGVQVGMRVVDARALLPQLHVAYADPGGDGAALTRLMRWARRWSPWTAVDGSAGETAPAGSEALVLDVTGCAHLFGGEAEMLRLIEAELSGLGLSARLAIAPSHGAAWALARFGPVRALCPEAELAERLAPLPVRALRLEEEAITLLNRLGLKTIGDLAALPRLSLARRFAREPLPRNPLLRLDQATGQSDEPLDAPEEPPRFLARQRLAEPVLDPVPLIPALAEALVAELTRAGHGARRLVLSVYRTDGETASASATTARASRDAAHFARLFEGKLDRLDPGFGFDCVTLSAPRAEPLGQRQSRLDARRAEGEELAALVDRLSARFGAHNLVRPVPAESHLPERAEHAPPALAGRPEVAAAPRPPGAPPRPIRLFEPPEEVRVIYAVPEGPPAQFIWRRVTHRVTRFAGPERIAPEWWQDSPGTRLRDYWRIEDHEGRRFWLYREGLDGDGRGGVPRWFMHGAFA